MEHSTDPLLLAVVSYHKCLSKVIVFAKRMLAAFLVSQSACMLKCLAIWNAGTQAHLSLAPDSYSCSRQLR